MEFYDYRANYLYPVSIEAQNLYEHRVFDSETVVLKYTIFKQGNRHTEEQCTENHYTQLKTPIVIGNDRTKDIQTNNLQTEPNKKTYQPLNLTYQLS